MEKCKPNGISFMYKNKNRLGPSTEPSGTPDLTGT